MRIFVYEYLTAHGIGVEPHSPDHGIYLEGKAMLDAVGADFSLVSGVEVTTLERHVEDDHEHEVWRVAEDCDWSLIIAPEFNGLLERFCWSVWTSAGKLVGSSVDAIRLASDKLALATYWRDCGVPTPATSDRSPTPCEAFPLVWKPRDGAGSTDTFLLTSAMDVARVKAQRGAESRPGPMILQEFVPGLAASVAFLCGPKGNVPLLPTAQLLTVDGRFKYQGGEIPLPDGLAERALRLGQRAVDCVTGLGGYVGVDLVLGAATDGSRDYAIEINPRLTTSYVGLRALADFNLAEAMLRAKNGDLQNPLRWKPGNVRFTPNAQITYF